MLSNFEMSYDIRAWPNMGKKMLHPGIKPLAKQKVAANDSVLGVLANTAGNGLTASTTYRSLIQTAFLPQYWNNTTQYVTLDANGNPVIKTGTASLTTDFTQIEFNFSFFFGLAIQAYEQTLVSDDTPYDKSKDVTPTGVLTPDQQAGLDVFLGKGKCIACHQGPEFTSASVSHIFDKSESGVIERMLMSDSSIKLYDNGFYNTTVRSNADDIGVGGTDPFGNPLALARLAKQNSPLIQGFGFPIDILNFAANAGLPVSPDEPDAVDGSFKTPTLRNTELTGPFMHNGGELTLEDVVDFYNRGGNFNNSEKHPDISSLDLTPTEKAQVVAFMKALTDDRVRYEKAPFDHPQLFVPNGHPYNPDGSLMLGTNAKGRDVLCEIPAVGADGGPALQSFVQLVNKVTTDPVYGPLGHTLSNCVVQPAPTDTVPPTGTYKGVINGKSTIEVKDAASGLSSVYVSTARNANVTVPEVVGQTTPVNITYTKIVSSQSATVSLQVTDIAGNVAIVDPWDTPVIRSAGVPEVINDLCSVPDTLALKEKQAYECGGAKYNQPVLHPDMEHNVTITNGAPGVTSVRIMVNRTTTFVVAALKDGEVRTIDIRSAMKNNANTFSVEALGKPGAMANVAFWGNDVPARKK